MPLTGNPSHDIPVELAAGKKRSQAIAIAMSEKRRKHGGDEDRGDAENYRVRGSGNEYVLSIRHSTGEFYDFTEGNRVKLFSSKALAEAEGRIQTKNRHDAEPCPKCGKIHEGDCSMSDGSQIVATREGAYWRVTGFGEPIVFLASASETEADAIRYARRKAGKDSSMKSTLMDILRGDAARSKALDGILEGVAALSTASKRLDEEEKRKDASPRISQIEAKLKKLKEEIRGKSGADKKAIQEDIDELEDELGDLKDRAADAVGRKYYTLLDPEGYIQFGDYSRSVVKQELEDQANSERKPKSKYKIVESGDSQTEIKEAVRKAGGNA
jgi:hypothetical protein